VCSKLDVVAGYRRRGHADVHRLTRLRSNHGGERNRGSVIGSYSADGSVAPDVPTNRVFYLSSSGAITAIDLATFAAAGSESFPLSPLGTASSLVRWGRYGFAFRVTDLNWPPRIWVVHSTLIPTQP